MNKRRENKRGSLKYEESDLKLKSFFETEVISEGRIIKEYNLREIMPINYLPDLLFYQTTLLLP